MFKAKDCKVSLNGRETLTNFLFRDYIDELNEPEFDPSDTEFNLNFDDIIDAVDYYEIHDDKIILFGFMGDNVIHIIRNNQDEVFNKICNYLIENHYDKYMG